MAKKPSINELILFCLFNKGKACDFEELLKECFGSFPKTFSFLKNKKWPDSRKLDRPLRALRKKNLIKGSSETKLSLTSSGKQKAQDVAKSFRQEKLKI